MKTEPDVVPDHQLIEMMDHLIQDGAWTTSSFLKVIHKKLQAARDRFVQETIEDKDKKDTELLETRDFSGKKEVFIILYSSEGGNLQAWERILMSLPKQVLSRPIYTSEDDVYQLIRSKESRINEAYVSVYIEESDIIALGEKTLFDRFGKSLLTLRDRAIDLDNIHYFFHTTGKYRFVKGQLIKA